jgi:hypothetical protein
MSFFHIPLLQFVCGEAIPNDMTADSTITKWGEEEVTFGDIKAPNWRKMRGAIKIEYACSHCRDAGLHYIWIDTCCIDKSSSAEPSEATNSRYNWYQDSTVCCVYPGDVYQQNQDINKLIRDSRWFTRS